MSKYTVIVVDPPWSYGSDTGRPHTAEAHYETMGNEGKEINRKTGAGIESIISGTPVIDLAAPDAHLYLWTTNPKLPFTFEIMRAWGFDYKTTLTWVKTSADGAAKRGGMGFFFRGATEHVLFGVKGSKPIAAALRWPNVVMAPSTGHSEKPVAFYEMLRQIYPAGEQMVDVYARQRHHRFEPYGNEVHTTEVLPLFG